MKTAINKKILIIASLALLAIVGFILTTATDRPADRGQTEEVTQNQIKITPPPAQPPAASGPRVLITNLGQDSSIVYVRAIAEGATSGDCRLVFAQGGQPSIERTAPLTLSGATYTCQGFDIRKADFPTKGEWNLTLALTDQSVASDQRTITIE